MKGFKELDLFTTPIEEKKPTLKGISVSQLAEQISYAIRTNFADRTFWVEGEVIDFRGNLIKQHTYFRLVDNASSPSTEKQASISVAAWRDGSERILAFERTTGQKFDNKLRVLILCRVNYDTRHGLSVQLLDVNPMFTVGNLALARERTLERLILEVKGVTLRDGVYQTANRQLKLPVFVTRVALLTAQQSDALHDFQAELSHLVPSFKLSIEHYPVPVQGKSAAERIVDTMRNIVFGKKAELIVIVRGGGSQADLLEFDSFELGRAIALCPIPVLTGIGHERNVSVADLMAFQSVKTPTKAAAFIQQHNLVCLQHVRGLFENTVSSLSRTVEGSLKAGAGLFAPVRVHLQDQHVLVCENGRKVFEEIHREIARSINSRLETAAALLLHIQEAYQLAESRAVARVTRNGIPVESVTQVTAGDELTLHFKDGSVRARIID